MRLLSLTALVVLATACRTDPSELDQDGDSFIAADDCNDSDPAVNPDAIEICDGIDNNCDEQIDDAGATDASTWYTDADGDGHGVEEGSQVACAAPEGTVASSDDCDDTNADVFPDAREDNCEDPVDYNCDGSVGYEDADGDGSPACRDCADDDATAFPDGSEVCDDVDNDCNGLVDEEASDASTFYADADGDGYGNPNVTESECAASAGFVADNTDCDDLHAPAYPGATETCDGHDTDCNGTVDDAADAPTWYADTDGDGAGNPNNSTQACDQPSGYLASATDCDDSDDSAYPGGTEVCDDVDNDCDGSTDESPTDGTTFYLDHDGDGYGDPELTTSACAQPSKYVTDNTDCNDLRAEANPAGTEVCGGVDENCDGNTDEATAADAATWYADSDADTYGDASVSQKACTKPSGYVSDSADCDDSSDQALPGGNEICDGLDNDCEGTTDENAADMQFWYADSDGDGYGDIDDVVEACDPPDGYVDNDGDCDDSDGDNFEDCCPGPLTSMGQPDVVFQRGDTHGTWGVDPLQTLGDGKVWYLNGYSGRTQVVQFDSLNNAKNNTNPTTFNVSPSWWGTGAQVYGGFLYYPEQGANNVIKWDITNNVLVERMPVPDAGNYSYQWGGGSHLDIAVDELGLWVIYATAGNGGRIVVSKIDEETMSITDTWNTTSEQKQNAGNAWMTCGELYVTDSYGGTNTTVNYAFDTVTSQSRNPNVPYPKAGNYNTQISYDPSTRLLYSWDNGAQAIYTPTFQD